MRHDVHGLDVTTGSRAALDAYDAATVGLLGWDASALDQFRAAATHDPQLAVAHAGAGVCLFLEERFDEARAAIESARTTVAGQSERERSHVEAMARRPGSHAWINLEYLSAESWVEGCHRLPSPHPRLPIVKHFFFPGFTPRTGGMSML